MNVNDLLAMGIEPLAFVDYIAIQEPNYEIMEQIGEGLANGARISRMTIVGVKQQRCLISLMVLTLQEHVWVW